MRAKGSRGLWLGSLALLALGVLLLLNNFLLLSGFNVGALWPLLLVIVGVLVLLRGDFMPGADARTFGITRGSVESATLEISAGEIDVVARALQREGRLIAGQFALDSRPQLSVQDTHAYLRMDRAATPWLSFANWEMALSRDLPWGIYVSTSLGQIDLDLRGLIIQKAVLATGLGDIQLTCPQEAFEPLVVRSAVGSIRILTPPGNHVRIYASGSRRFNVYADENRYTQPEPGVYVSRDSAANAPAVEIYVSGTLGDAYFA
ncbi:MAG TPA: hypothetical protein VK003_12580 [Oceanobacillus sp.]|nr:hypothetical protein [Oceanobacillus sp.]